MDRKAVLADPEEVTGQRNALLLFWGLHSDVEAAETHTGQMLGLNLKTRENICDSDGEVGLDD